MLPQIYTGWDELKKNPGDEKQWNRLTQAVKFFMQQPAIYGSPEFDLQNSPKAKQLNDFRNSVNRTYQMQNYGMSTIDSFPKQLEKIWSTFDQMEMFDDAWRIFFQMVPNQGVDYFRILIYDNTGYEFKRMPWGKSIEYQGGVGSTETVQLYFYGGGHLIDRRFMMVTPWFEIEKQLRAFRSSAFRKRSQVFTALIEALDAGRNVTWKDPYNPNLANTSDTYYEQKDIATLKFGVEKLFDENRDKLMVMPNGLMTTFVLLHPFELTDRYHRAINLMWKERQPDAFKFLSYKIVPQSTISLSDPTKSYLGIPGGLIQGSEMLDLTIFNRFNQDNFTSSTAGWMGYGGAILDEEQLVRIFSA